MLDRATYLRSVEMFDDYFITNLLLSLLVKKLKFAVNVW